jgi:hypothetical protein
MTNYVASITIDQVIDALAAFLAPFVPGGEIVRAQVNRVAMPKNPCAILTELLDVDLCVPYEDYATTIATIHGPSRVDVQVDFYGALAGSYCKSVKAALRSQYGFNHFTANIRPLYTTDGVQSPLTTGEQQYESRWTLTVSMQYNPTVTVPQDTADVVTTEPPNVVDLPTP